MPMNEANQEVKKEWKPKIVAFCCNWCSYAGADLAGSSRLVYPADVKIIRVPCSCREFLSSLPLLDLLRCRRNP